VEVDYQELPAVADMETAIDGTTPVIHPDLGDKFCFRRAVDIGEVTNPSPAFYGGGEANRSAWKTEPTASFAAYNRRVSSPRRQ